MGKLSKSIIMTKAETLSLCRHIEQIVVNVFALDYNDYQAHKIGKKQEYAECRFVVSAMCKKYVKGASLKIIGQLLKKEHSTALFNINRCYELAEIDANYRAKIEQCDADIVASGVLTARKPAYFLGFTDNLNFNRYHISEAIEAIIDAGYYLTDINSIITFKTELKTVGGVIFLGGVD